MTEYTNHQGDIHSRISPSERYRYKHENCVVLYSVELDLSSLVDDKLLYFIARLLYWFSLLSNAQKWHNVIEGWVDSFFDIFSLDHDDVEDKTIISSRYNKKRRNINYLVEYDTSLSSYLYYKSGAIFCNFKSKLRYALASIPSMAEVLHGATYSNAFCTYII